MRYILGNWKANKTTREMTHWIQDFKLKYKPHDSVVVGIFPSSVYLSELKKQVGTLKNVAIGAQTISSFEQGSYTGEITALHLQDNAGYVIIGHSERRKHFGETDQDLNKKVRLALSHKITPIYCIRDEKDPIPPEITIVAYEPIAAIGTGYNEAPSSVVSMKQKLKLPPHVVFLYGGSVNGDNAKEYLSTNQIHGFLIGKASLNVDQFLSIVNS